MRHFSYQVCTYTVEVVTLTTVEVIVLVGATLIMVVVVPVGSSTVVVQRSGDLGVKTLKDSDSGARGSLSTALCLMRLGASAAAARDALGG